MQESFINDAGNTTVELHFKDLEEFGLRYQRLGKNLTSEATKVVAAAEQGDLSALRKALSLISKKIHDISSDIDPQIWNAPDRLTNEINNAGFLREIQAAAESIGLDGISTTRNAILSHPHRLTFDGATGFRIGRKLFSSMRPSAVARILKNEREKGATLVPGFLEALHSAYTLITKPDSGVSVPLSNLHAVLTLLPGAAKSYTEADFVRDVGLLSERGPHVTKDGFTVSFPASTSARLNGGYTVVKSDGRETLLASIRFDRA